MASSLPSPSPLPTYAIVTPVRDEAANFTRMAASVVAQSYRPRRWIIVDDGSTDGTTAIAERYAGEHDWIHVVAAEGRHRRGRGAPIVRAFEAGRRQLDAPVDVIVKLDGDLHLPPHYFEWV